MEPTQIWNCRYFRSQFHERVAGSGSLHDRNRWHGLRRLAADKTTLALPESKSLWKAFGAHNGERGLGTISVELCCLFDLVSRAPLRFVYGKASTSEHKLIRKLIESLRKNDLLLLDTGFYYCSAHSDVRCMR